MKSPNYSVNLLAANRGIFYTATIMQDNHVGVLLEDIQGKLQGLAESMSVMQQDIATMKPQVALIPQIAADVQTLKAVQTDQGQELRDHEDYLKSQGMPSRA